MNKSQFAREHTANLGIKKAKGHQLCNIIYRAYMAGMKKERELSRRYKI